MIKLYQKNLSADSLFLSVFLQFAPILQKSVHNRGCNCKKLKKVTIGKYVTTIGKNAFYGDKKLKKIVIKTKKLKKVGKNALKGISKTAQIQVPKSKRSKYKKLFKKSTGYVSTMKVK